MKNNDLIKRDENFVSEISNLVNKLKQPGSDLYRSASFLKEKRLQLLNGELPEDEQFNQLLEEYLKELGCWLKEISFLANYRLASIKGIDLDYWLGSAKNFVHTYGELHGVYNQHNSEQKDLMTQSIKDVFTYSRSVLFFKGNNIADCLNQIKGNTEDENKHFLSLSPLIIDHSVLVEKEETKKQTPEIYYYTGYESNTYHFSYYKNELVYKTCGELSSNKSIVVKKQNDNLPKFDELFAQLEQIRTN